MTTTLELISRQELARRIPALSERYIHWLAITNQDFQQCAYELGPRKRFYDYQAVLGWMQGRRLGNDTTRVLVGVSEGNHD